MEDKPMAEEKVVDETQTTSASPTETKTVSPEKSPSSAHQEGAEVQQEEKKPSRLERRVEQIEGKRKRLEEEKRGLEEFLQKLKGQTSVQEVPKWMRSGEEPLVKEEELTEGIDPRELERRVQERLERVKNEAITEATQRMRFQQLVAEHLADVQSAEERFPELNKNNKETYDPDFEAEVVRLYNLYNTVYNPITDKKEFVPAVKLSEVYNEVKKKWEKIMQRKLSQTREKIVEQVSSSAIPPSGVKEASYDLEEEELFEKARHSGKDEDWARVLKKRLNIKSL